MVDNKDLLIINALKDDSKASVARIAKTVGLPSTTVHHRIQKLKADGVIRGYTIRVNQGLLGKKIAAYLAITVDYKLLKKKKLSQHALAEELGKLPVVEAVSIITGISDVIVKLRVKNVEELNDFVTKKIRNYDGVKTTQTMVILEEVID
ncbi:MAG: hypothetical protein CL943_03595 [Candidatus Diapherotrites archaeon]|uniref:HTH asnC-type domain-containing protein n=1 Tax=Candidatus Iainarchaeum sp. TaxID=3101447 RepID=A0A2D6M1P5_9ARCH|nr:hypothetical protein [Candidatus Diapherotrites archaeon]|tara:strand:+ start:801 stop:1250 length:450 start_codon:yes stop_codon:yes gene_type:complete